MLRIAVLGAAGRMGNELMRAITESDEMTLAAAITREGSEKTGASPSMPGARSTQIPEPGGRDRSAVAPTIPLDQLASSDFDACIEFTHADAIVDLAPRLAALGRPWISGTTGLDSTARAALEKAAESIPVLWAPNMSLGATLLLRLLDQAARFLPRGWEMELVETHHAAKRDAPSGTALALAEQWRRLRGGEISNGRHGLTGPRSTGEIGIHAVRLPEGVGEHRVLLGGWGEMLELSHRATDRAAFARGALQAAAWLAGQQKAGLYTLEDWAEDRLRGIPR